MLFLLEMSASSSSSSKCNIVVLGSGSVGKSSLVVQYVQGVFLENYDPTIMDVLMKGDVIDGVNTVVSLVDTTGQREFADHRAPYIRDADGILFVFSIVDGGSILELSNLLEQVVKARSSRKGGLECPFLVVGNKNDLEAHRVVRISEGEKFCQLAWRKLSGQPALESAAALPYLETSAKILDDAQLCVHMVVRMIRVVRETGKICNIREAMPSPPVVEQHAALPSPVSTSPPMNEGPLLEPPVLAVAAEHVEPKLRRLKKKSTPNEQPPELPPATVKCPPPSTATPTAKKKKKGCTMI